jgi:hypothetical protein
MLFLVKTFSLSPPQTDYAYDFVLATAGIFTTRHLRQLEV